MPTRSAPSAVWATRSRRADAYRPAHPARHLRHRRAGRAAAGAGVPCPGQARRAPGPGGHAGRHGQRPRRARQRRSAGRPHRRWTLCPGTARGWRTRPGRSHLGLPEARDQLPRLRDRCARHRRLRQQRSRSRRGLLALERRPPDPARPLRRALQRRGPGRPGLHRDARRGADPRQRRRHSRRAHGGQAEPRDRAVHRTQPEHRAGMGRAAARSRAAGRRRHGGLAVAPARRAATLRARGHGGRTCHFAAHRRRVRRTRTGAGVDAHATGGKAVRRTLCAGTDARNEEPAGGDPRQRGTARTAARGGRSGALCRRHRRGSTACWRWRRSSTGNRSTLRKSWMSPTCSGMWPKIAVQTSRAVD